MREFGGGMPCVYKVRANGVAPVPAADACEQAHKSGPNTRRPHHFRPRSGRFISLKRAGCGAEPHGFRARSARSFS